MTDPHRVLLFSGHMIDAPGRPVPRFPAGKEASARQAIDAVMQAIGAGPADLAICGGACGGDLLFAESALARGTPLEMYLPFAEDRFVVDSVDFAGGDWHERFDAASAASSLHLMPQERPMSAGQNPYEETNLWMLEAAGRFGTDKVEFICLWDGKSGDGPGGAQHLMQEVKQRAGRIHWIKSADL